MIYESRDSDNKTIKTFIFCMKVLLCKNENQKQRMKCYIFEIFMKNKIYFHSISKFFQIQI